MYLVLLRIGLCPLYEHNLTVSFDLIPVHASAGVCGGHPEAIDERVAYWEWEDDDEDAMLRGEEEEEVWE
jgi:hypothetical protein